MTHTEIIWTVVPGMGTTGVAPIVTRVTNGDPGQIPQAARKLLERDGSIGICTSTAGDVLVVITDDGHALLDPEAIQRLTDEIVATVIGPFA